MEESSRIFDDEEDGEEEVGHREGSSSRQDRKGNGIVDQQPGIPRSKHSAMEQRRRSKINDRFQILRGLIPQGDEKRDKASFLLEVIEYIRLLQEKVQKYESACPVWNQETTKLMPWVEVYFLSFWKNALNNNLAHEDGLFDSSQTGKDSSTSSCMFTGKFDGSSQLVTLIPGADNKESQQQHRWVRSSGPLDFSKSSEMPSKQERDFDKGTTHASAAYSQGMLMMLTQALQCSGLDMSQTSISVQINIGKRTVTNRNAAVRTSSDKNLEDPATQAPKRQRTESC